MKISITDVCKQRLEQRMKTPDRAMSLIQMNFITNAFEQARNLHEIETAQSSPASIDTLLNHEFVGYYLLALSSLDRNKHDCKLPRVVVWSDGSLNQSDIELLFLTCPASFP